MTKDTIFAQPGNSALRKEVGEDFRIGGHITEDRIRSCSAIIEQAGDDFYQDAEADLAALEALANAPKETPVNYDLALHHVYNIRSLAKVLGFTLITEICVHLSHVVEDRELTDVKRKRLVAKLAEALRLAFTQRIRDDGGAMGKALLVSLRSLL